MQYLFILCLILFSTTPVIEFGTYTHNEKGSTHTLIINKDSTFSYIRPGVVDGIITEKGKWDIVGDGLFLIDSVYLVHSKSKTTGQVISGQNYVVIKVVDENNLPLSGMNVALNEDNLYKQTDNEGVVIFGYGELKYDRPNQPANTVEVVELKTKLWSVKTIMSNHFDNEITIVHDLHPKETVQPRIRKIEIRKNSNSLLFYNPTGLDESQMFEFRKIR
jgi:hypothetical protein